MAAFMTNLLEAVHRENIPRVKALLSRGDDVNTADAQGVTPLMVACERGELDMVDLLLEAKASTKCVTSDTQSTCLHFAARTQSAEVVRRILSVDPTIHDRAATQGDTALMLACLSAKENEATAATLAAMLEIPPSSKATAQGGSGGGGEGSKFPLGPDDPRLRASNRHGHTALHCAAFASSPTAVRMLLEAGADCTMGDKAGRTAFDVAMNLAGKKTPVREAGRGGSTPAVECLALLRERWRQLEREARDKEMRLLGELDAGPEEDRGVGGKGRRGGGGTRETLSSGGRKGSRKKKKKNQPQQHQPERSSPSGGGHRAQTAASSEANKDAGSPPLNADVRGLGIDDVATSRDPDEGVEGGVVSVNPGVSSKGGVVGKRESSDSEGETDDEAGSHPSSDADNGSNEDPADRIDVTVAAAPVAVSVEAEEEAGAADVVEEEPALTSAESNAVDGNDTSRRGLDDAEATDGEGVGSEGSWSVVGPKVRKKKAASPALRLQPAMVAPPSSRYHHPRSMTPPSESGSSRTRTAFGGARVSRPTSPRIAEFPPLPGGVRSSRVARGAAPSRGRAAGITTGPASTRVHRAVEPAAKAALVSRPSVPEKSSMMPAVKTAAAGEPAQSADVVAPVVEMPTLIAPAFAGAVDNAEAQGASLKAVAVVAPEEEGAEEGVRSNGEGTGSGPGVKRQLNVNANAWTPSVVQEQRQHNATRPPPPLPVQQQMQHMSVTMPIQMHHVQPPPQQQQQQQQPIPFTGVPMGSGGLRHQPPPHPLQHTLSHPPHPAVWTSGGAGGGGQQLPYNNIASHTGTVSGPGVGFGAGFFEMRQPSPIQMVPVVPGVSGSLPGSLAPPPPQMIPTPQGVMMSGGVRGDVGCVPGTGKTSSEYVGQEVRADGAQEMLEASSPEAAALALKVEHLVWSVESMSAGLSMGQLDTLKAYLLDQAARVDEAKLEQVRAQERSKNEEKANIQQLHQTQGGAPDATVVVTVDAADTAVASALASGVGGESVSEGACVDASAPGGALDKNNSSCAGGSNMITAPSEGGGVAVTGGAGVEDSGHQSEELEGVRGGVREGGDVVVKPQLEKRGGNQSSTGVAEESTPPGNKETR